MTAEELAAFVTDVRAQVEATLAWLATIDPQTLPRDIRADYEAHVQRCRDLLARLETDAVALHEKACIAAGRELTQAEARALTKRQ